MIERHVVFEVIPEQIKQFEDLFINKYRPAMSEMPGFVKVELLREQETPARYQMVIRFNTLEEAAGWRASPAHQALSPKIKALYTSSNVTVYEVIA